MTNKIMELADVYAESEASTDPRYMTQHARAALQAEVARVEQELAGTEAVNKAAALEIVSLRAELEAAKADVERMKHLVANVRCADANIDGQHTWNFLWGKGWTTGASFREAVDNAKKG